MARRPGCPTVRGRRQLWGPGCSACAALPGSNPSAAPLAVRALAARLGTASCDLAGVEPSFPPA